MKIEINTKEFQNAITKLMKVALKKSSIKIIEGILIEATKESVTLTTTDLSNRVSLELSSPYIDDAGSFVLPSETAKLILKLKSNNITITNGVIYSDNRELKFSGLDAENYPKSSNKEYSHEAFKLPLSEFSKVCDIRYACSTSEATPILTGVLMTNEKVVSCDRHRLAQLPFNADLKSSIVIGSETLKIIEMMQDKKSKSEIIGMVDIEELKIQSELKHNNIKFKFDNVTIESRLIDGNYPDTSKIISNSFQTEIKLKKSELIEELTLAKEISDNKTYPNFVQVVCANNILTLSSKDTAESNTMSANLDASYVNGSELEKMSFNAAYMLDGLKYNNNEYVTLKFNGKLSPIMVDSECLILPYRTTA